MDKVRRKVSYDREVDEYIRDYMEENKISYNGDAIARICKEHKEMKDQEWSLKYITEVVTQNIHSVLQDEMTKIRLASNSADKNTQVLVELMNGLYFANSIEDTLPTNVQEMEGVRTAKKVVQDRITEQRQKKIDWEQSRQKS